MSACVQPPSQPETPPPPAPVQVADTLPVLPAFTPFDRSSIRARLEKKKEAGIPLVVHVFVPLCDNEHQGIIPVNASLGDGMNLKTNLYWGARYGVKSHFRNRSSWELLESRPDPGPDVLERVIFKKTYSPTTSVILIADAYRGDRMTECVAGFFSALAGATQDTIYQIFGSPDLLAFNGHNGLMDFIDLDPEIDRDTLRRDAAVIACASNGYFHDRLNYAGGYPLVTTTNLMAPEAYVLEAVIDSWAQGQTENEILNSAGVAYHHYQQCGEKGARRLFTGGW